MTRTRSLSAQARLTLAALADAAPDWSHGYALCKAAGIKSGTLYPLLMRLETQNYLEAQWQAGEVGRPPRHAYRLTATGLQLARDNPPLSAAGSGGLVGKPA